MGEPAGLSLTELEAAAREVWAALESGGVLWLTGDLGSGKTTFVQALARAAHAAAASSPTYALVQEYASPAGPIAHVDCYRLRSPEEARDLDFAGLAARMRLIVIEWPERAGRYAPPPDVHLRFDYADVPDRRMLERIA